MVWGVDVVVGVVFRGFRVWRLSPVPCGCSMDTGCPPSVFSDSHILNVHGHGWWDLCDSCSGLGRLQPLCVWGGRSKMCEGQWRAHVRGVVEGMDAIRPFPPQSRTDMSVLELAVGLVGPIVILSLGVSVSHG